MEGPEQTAIIHVKKIGPAGEIQLTCWGHYAERTLTTKPFAPPKLCLADFIEEADNPDSINNILNTLRNFSESNPDLELIAWVNGLRKRLGEEMQLVIVDHTDTEIPWEILELDDGVYLGAEVTVVRWLPLPHYEGNY